MIDPISESLCQGQLGANIVFFKNLCFLARSSRNPKVAFFRDFSNFLRRRFHALGMDLAYFLLNMDESLLYLLQFIIK